MANVGSPFMNSCILTSVGVLAVIVNSSVISKIGRRRVFLMTGLSICGVSQLIIATVYHVQPGTVRTGKVSSVPIQFKERTHWQKLGHCRSLSCVYLRLQRYGRRVRLAVGWRNSLSASALIHFRHRVRSWFPGCVARHVHGALLHQPRIFGLGTGVWYGTSSTSST
jgi:hypothetical protein